MYELKQLNNIKSLVNVTMVLLVVTHFIYFLIFYFIDIETMAKFKFIEFIVNLIVAFFIILSKRFYNLGVYFTHFAILISCAGCTYIVGQGYGFLNVFIAILSLGYVHNFKTSKYPFIIGIIEIILLIVVFYLTKDIPNYDSKYMLLVYFVNIFAIAFIVIFYSIAVSDNKKNQSKILDEEKSKLQAKVDYDYLTKILNRKAMNEILSKYYDYFQKDKIRSMVLVLGDIDNFKNINDMYGHIYGDIVLKNTANIIKNKISDIKNSYVSRWGGEEFLIFLTGMNVEEVEKLINDIKNDFSNYIHSDGYNSKKATITFGICYALRVESIDYMLSQADTALYNGKKSGKNRVELILLGQI
ncbi:GGDEF domain-containing protein [Campylobacter sp. MG1]|uniref:GGDEF domain-containing protein n=1 Tax=Campylobacter sp. MG1 TaxID=2976332 RepID=UPI00226D37FB|nr:GGDEF domain-containing protein [Campylobacter sp. MG1]